MEAAQKPTTIREKSHGTPGVARNATRPQSVGEETIAAISTPPGEGGIGIVRLSGSKAIAVAAQIFVSSKGRTLDEGGRIFHGEIRDGDSTVDEVLLHVMRAPHTYTCEDVVEINCHGGAAPLNAVLDLSLRHGARLAEPGEFTKRAFLNGRIDLVQAEAVADRIRAMSRGGLQAAAAAARGQLSEAIYELRDTLTTAAARIEAAVDFPEEDLPELVDDELRHEVEGARDRMVKLLETADAGRLYREGVSAAIVGRTNVGKSSLFNALLRERRAIVTAHPGTTRDVIEEMIQVEGIPLRLMDTAGMRPTDDEVERIGIEVTREALNRAAMALFVVDSTVPVTEEDLSIAQELQLLEIPAVLALNKIDLQPHPPVPKWDVEFSATCEVSAKTGEGLEALEAAVAKLLLGGVQVAPDQTMITRLHQKDSLRRALEAVNRVLTGLDEGAPELLSIDVKEALAALGEITGETTPDDVLDQIFSSFCIGK